MISAKLTRFKNIVFIKTLFYLLFLEALVYFLRNSVSKELISSNFGFGYQKAGQLKAESQF